MNFSDAFLAGQRAYLEGCDIFANPFCKKPHRPKKRADWIDGWMDQQERMSPAFKKGYLEGVKAAAEFAGQWNSQIDHPYRFEDTILCKFNLRKKPRRKRKA